MERTLKIVAARLRELLWLLAIELVIAATRYVPKSLASGVDRGSIFGFHFFAAVLFLGFLRQSYLYGGDRNSFRELMKAGGPFIGRSILFGLCLLALLVVPALSLMIAVKHAMPSLTKPQVMQLGTSLAVLSLE